MWLPIVLLDLALLGDDDWEVRVSAQRRVQAAMAAGDLEWAVRPLTLSPDPEVRRRAAAILERHSDLSGDLPYFPRLEFIERALHPDEVAEVERAFPREGTIWDEDEIWEKRRYDRQRRAAGAHFLYLRFRNGESRADVLERAMRALERERQHGVVRVSDG